MRTRKASFSFVLATIPFVLATSTPADDAIAVPKDQISNEVPDTSTREETERRLHSLTQELARIGKQHGSDAVALQVGLLLHTLSAGAVGATQVQVVGESRHSGPDYLELEVETGIIFDSDVSTSRSELEHMWDKIAVPTLDGMETFNVEPHGVEIVFGYSVQRFGEFAERKAHPAEPSDPRTLRVTIPEAVLADLTAGAAEPAAVLTRCTVHDGVRVLSAQELGLE